MKHDNYRWHTEILGDKKILLHMYYCISSISDESLSLCLSFIRTYINNLHGYIGYICISFSIFMFSPTQVWHWWIPHCPFPNSNFFGGQDPTQDLRAARGQGSSRSSGAAQWAKGTTHGSRWALGSWFGRAIFFGWDMLEQKNMIS